MSGDSANTLPRPGVKERAILALLPEVRRNLRDLVRLEVEDADAIERMQSAKLERLIRHFARDEGFRNRTGIDSNHGVMRAAALEDLPITTKNDLREWTLRHARAPQAYRKNSTSGSTGVNLVFHQSRSMVRARTAAVTYTYRLLGVDYWSDRKVIVWGRSPWLGTRTRLRLALNRRLLDMTVLEGFAGTHDAALAQLDRIEQLRPVLLEGYPSYLGHLALEGMASGRRAPALPPRTVIVTSGEQLEPDQRAAIETWFGRPVFNRYGSREFGVIAVERPEFDGLWVPPTRFILENGPDGEMLVTDLDNYACPFMRYNIGDVGRVESLDGRQVVRQLEGRMHDIIRTPDGTVLPGQFWTLLVRSVPGIREFQVVQTDPDAVALRVVADPAFDDEARRLLLERIGAKCGGGIAVRIDEVDVIPLTSLGKRRFVIGLQGDVNG